MRSVKSTTLRKLLTAFGVQILVPIALGSSFLYAQDNSPYSRYALGDAVPNTSIVTRGMGGVSAAYADPLSVNFNNPASYSAFRAYLDQRSRKANSGRVLFDVGVNFDNRTLKEVNPPQKFASSNAVFSYMQIGLPIKNNWGVNFGLRQLTRVGYKVVRFERLLDPVSGDPIDSTVTEFTGDGGTFLANIGTGFSVFNKAVGRNRRSNLNLGFNFGYLFGKKELFTKRAFINDTVEYKSSNHSSETSFGNIFINGGFQYHLDLDTAITFNFGAYGNLKQNMNGEQDIIRETFVRTDNGDIRLDSVYQQNGVKGKVVYPASFGIGFSFERRIDVQNNKFGSWLIGADLEMTGWKDYRFYGLQDSVRNSWVVRVGGQIRPQPKGRNYFSNVAYRAGFFFGKDYIHVGKELPTMGLSFGIGLPIPNYNRLALNQASIINFAFEYIKRGNNDNSLKDNLFRISLGLSFSDLWFVKRRYE